MKKLIFSLILILSGGFSALYGQSTTSRATQAEQLINTYFDQARFIDEIKSEFSISDKLFEKYEPALMQAIFKKRIEFIKGFVAGKETVYTIESSFALFKSKVRAKIKEVTEANLVETDLIDPQFNSHNHTMELRGPGDPCTNPDFEMCNFTNWELIQGTVPYPSTAPFSFTNPTPTTSYSTVNSSVAVAIGSGYDQHYICNGGTDAIGGFPMVYPGGTCTAAIGDFNNYNYGASQIRQTFLASSGNAILTLNYAVCLEDAGHTAAEQPYFRMRVYDQAGNSIGCAEYEAVAGDGQLGWVNTGTWQYKPWTTVFIPLAPYIGQNITVEFTVGDCAQGGHAGYAYVDASCTAMSFNMSAQSVCAGQPITITAPTGASSYLWNTGATTQSITTSTAGNYSVTVTPVTGSACAITLDTTVMSFPNPNANFNDDAPACAGDPVNFNDQSNAGSATITSWFWDFGDGNTSTLQDPTHIYAAGGTYNVTLTVTTSDGCTDTDVNSVTITNGGNPGINPAGPFCASASSVTLTAASSGGTWSATCGSCINATTGSFNPALATVGNNTITYTITGGCGGTDTEVIVVEDISLDNITPTDILCFGDCTGSLTIAASGATQFSIDGGASFQATGNFTSLCAGGFNIVAQTAIGCQVTGLASINQPTQLTIPTSFNDETCFGSCDGDATANPQGGTSPYNFSWSNGGGNVPTINNLCVGNYVVDVTDNNGCLETATIIVSGPPQVVINSVTEVDETCTNSCDGSITISSPLATQFSIDNGATFQASNVFNNVCSGNYSIVVQDAAGCQASDVAAITTPNPINIVPGPNSTICIGESAVVSASASGGTAPLDLIWDNGLPIGITHTVTPLVNTTYSVYAQDANGCQSPIVQISVSINPPLQVVAQSDQAICPGETAIITASASGGNGGPYTYIWDDGAGNQLSGSTQVVSPTVTTSYTVTASDNCGTPVATDLVTITVNPLPVVSFLADNLQGCTPVSVNFSNTTNVALTGTCFWDFGDGTTSSNCNPNHVYTEPGCYTVTLTVTSPDGCVASTFITNMICVYEYPIAEFSFGPQPADIFNTEINFTNETYLGSSYEWDFAGLGTSQQTHPSFVFPSDGAGSYDVCLATATVNGCADTICHTVIIDDVFLLYVPNTFTPDGDGINDLFFPVIDGYDAENFKMMIFNRWGELIFESDTPENKWDGTHRSLMSKEDTYVWKIITKDLNSNKKREFVGHVNLLK